MDFSAGHFTKSAQQANMFGNMMLFMLFVVLAQDGPISAMFWNEVFRMSQLLRIPGFLIGMGMDQFY